MLTKKEQGYLDKYLRSPYYSVRDAYRRPSDRKIFAEEAISDEMMKNGGRNYRILSFNTNFFTCAYMNNGRLVVHTPSNRIEIVVA